MCLANIRVTAMYGPLTALSILEKRHASINENTKISGETTLATDI
jgi:hypothetical protein